MYRKNVIVVEYVILIFFVSVLVSDKIEFFRFVMSCNGVEGHAMQFCPILSD